MVSIYSLRPVYIFLYTIINDNIMTSFLQKKRSFEILLSKKIFFCMYATWDPPPPLYAIVGIWVDPSPPHTLCAYVLCG